MRRYTVHWFVITLLWVLLIFFIFYKSAETKNALSNMQFIFKEGYGRLINGLTVADNEQKRLVIRDLHPSSCIDAGKSFHRGLIPDSEITVVSGVEGLKPYFVKINSDGFRGREYVVEKPSSMFRIVVLGDSFTFGWGLNLEETFCYRLEEMLNREIPERRFEVLNFGVPGANTMEEVERFKEKALKYSPDLVIIGFLGNDDENPEVNLLFNDFIHKNFTREEWGIEYKKIKNNRTLKNIKFIKKPFEELISFSEKFGFPILVYAFGVESYQDKFLTDLERSYDGFYFQKASFNFGGNRKFYLHPLDHHPSALANEMYAQEIYDTINRYNLLHP